MENNKASKKKKGKGKKAFSFTVFNKGVSSGGTKGKIILACLSALITPVLIVVICVVALVGNVFGSVFSNNNFLNQEVDDLDAYIGEVCEFKHGETYELIKNDFISTTVELENTLKNYITSTYTVPKEIGEEGNLKTLSSDGKGPLSIDLKTNAWKYSYDSKENIVTKDDGKDAEGNLISLEEYKVHVDIPVKLVGIDYPEQLINSIVGYIQANYGVINTYSGENLEGIVSDIEKTQNVTTTFGFKTPDGNHVMTEDYCNEVGGKKNSSGTACTWTYKPETITKTKNGTCTFKDNKWNNNGSSNYECSTGEWARKNNKSTMIGTTVNPSEGDSYNYTYTVTEDATQIDVSNFNLDDYKTAIEKYINSGMLFYFNQGEWNLDDIVLTENVTTETRTKKVKVKETVSEKKTITCTYNGKDEMRNDIWVGENCNSLANVTGKKGETRNIEINSSKEIEKIVDEQYETKITTYSLTTKKDIEVSIKTGIDSSDKDFLGDAKETTIKNLDNLNKVQGIDETGEYSYNEALNEIIGTLNFICPEYQIDTSLITGSSYSSFAAVTSAVNAPGVFGESKYFYDSSKGIWDVSQLSRQDTYQAVWQYDLYLVKNGLVTGSGWWNGGLSPQCTDFVHARFYAQYGYDCGAGNGVDMARNTVAKYPDKFYDGVVNGGLQLKAGSVISKSGNTYGHVGFVEAVETDDNGKITSITISDANFTFSGCAGGIRLHCTYTWEQFMSAWGPNCTFAVPIN